MLFLWINEITHSYFSAQFHESMFCFDPILFQLSLNAIDGIVISINRYRDNSSGPAIFTFYFITFWYKYNFQQVKHEKNGTLHFEWKERPPCPDRQRPLSLHYFKCKEVQTAVFITVRYPINAGNQSRLIFSMKTSLTLPR